ncbi:MAG: permease [Spirochaetota bacterium]
MITILNEMLYFYIEIAPYMVLGLVFVALLHRFISKSMIARHMGEDNLLSSFKGALLGVPLPLCSCGVVPSAVYFSKNGASRSSVISFLISTPQTGVDSIIATYGALGPIFALFRPLAAFVSGVIGGSFTSFITKNDAPLSDDSCTDGSCLLPDKKKPTNTEALSYAFVDFLDDISVQFVIGVLIAGMISVLIPEDFFASYGIDSGFTAMALMIAVGIPMYVCATASIPIGLALLAKGVSPGAVFVFLAVGPLTNAASLTVLYRVLKGKILFLYVASGTIFAVLFGILLDYIFALLGHGPGITYMAHEHGMQSLISFEAAVSALFALFLGASVYRKVRNTFFSKGESMNSRQTATISISGMSCNHCRATVTDAVSKVPGVESVDVNLERGEAVVEGNADIDRVKQAICDAGYSVE